MNKESRGKDRQGINNTTCEWKLVPIIRQRDGRKAVPLQRIWKSGNYLPTTSEKKQYFCTATKNN